MRESPANERVVDDLDAALNGLDIVRAKTSIHGCEVPISILRTGGSHCAFFVTVGKTFKYNVSPDGKVTSIDLDERLLEDWIHAAERSPKKEPVDDGEFLVSILSRLH
ncbi:hypothetical protein HZA45_01440 [Candidatus Peregrinibacteria bacterium]|nr:hypothetical protein [Candidatus Peregrinibacteria bacterium]